MNKTRLGPNVFVAALLAALALAAAGCSGATPTPSPTPTPVPTGVLLSVETRGGRCVNGPCGTTVFVERDGLVRLAAKPPNELGLLSAEALAALDEVIQATDFAALRSHRFTGECPTAYDGQEIVFEFGSPNGLERIATCEVAVDLGSPLFAIALGAVGPYMSLPTP